MLIPRNLGKILTKSVKVKTPNIDISTNANKITKFITENPETVTAIIGILFSSRHILRSLIVSHRVKQEAKRKERTLYDPRTGVHYILRRELTPLDYQYINDRRKEGAYLYDILCSINAI